MLILLCNNSFFTIYSQFVIITTSCNPLICSLTFLNTALGATVYTLVYSLTVKHDLSCC